MSEQRTKQSPGSRYDVFVSYRWTEPDRSWVRDHLVPALKRAGLKVCLDVEDFIPGRDLILEMSRAGLESRVVLCVLSPAYFAGNRMVALESLASRRADPSGGCSRLVPLILREAPLPDWIRGLIPVDWTHKEDRNREWKKLLQVLGAETTGVPAPPAARRIPREVAVEPLANVQSQMRIVRVVKLSPREGSGLGYELLLKNDANDAKFVVSADLSGVRELECHGAGGVVHRLAFEVLLDSATSQQGQGGGATEIVHGTVFDADSQDWGVRCEGSFNFEANTWLSRKTWEYSLSVPCAFRIAAGDHAIVRLLFRKASLQVLEEYVEGKSGGEHQTGLIRDEHTISVSLESGEAVTTKIDAELLRFIAN